MDKNPATDSLFQVNRVITLQYGEALIQRVETGVDLALRWPWQQSVLCSRASATCVLEMTGVLLKYQHVIELAPDLEQRQISAGDLGVLTSAPTKLYSELQGQGGWW